MRAVLVLMVAIVNSAAARAEDAVDRDVAMYGSVATLFTDAPVGFAMIDARVPVTSHLTATAALAHLDPSGAREEQQVRLSLTAAVPISKYAFDDRLLWVRSDTHVEHWRNRWRIFMPSGFRNTRWVMFDELYYSEPRGFYRNVVAAGVSITPVSRVTGDVLYMYIDNRHASVSHSLLLMLSFRFD